MHTENEDLVDLIFDDFKIEVSKVDLMSEIFLICLEMFLADEREVDVDQEKTLAEAMI
ncbi:MAG: hypothetical protein ACOZBL_02065 [Patescibacteria group bacterium]